MKISVYGCIAGVLIALAAGLRIVLAALGWPPTNSDEGTMAIMALNIAYRGEHPPLYYGQDYMGSLEAHLGALFFRLFGSPSLFSLRLGVILLTTLFLVSMYLLTSLLFSRKLALVTLAFLSVGSIPMLTRQMIATGGSTQTLFFGVLAFLIAAWLALTWTSQVTPRARRWRLVVYAGWGLVIGLGVWSDMVVAPFFAMAGLLLLLFCWRELLPWRWLVIVGGICIGMLPEIPYDLQRHLNPFTTTLSLSQGSYTKAPDTLPGIVHNILAVTQVSIPTATGNPFCPVQEMPWLGDTSPHILSCTIAHALWGDGYLLLLVVALVSVWRVLQKTHMHEKTLKIGKIILEQNDSIADRKTLVRQIAQLLLAGGALLAIVLYTLSSGPVDQPVFHARYLVSLLIATPALLAPLWNAVSKLKMVRTGKQRSQARICGVLLVLIWLLLCTGTVQAFSEVSAAQAASQQREDLIHQLVRINVHHIYTEYWTCNNLIFASDEQITCAVLDYHLRLSHNRAPRYAESVKADPNSAYVFPIHVTTALYDALPAVERMVAQAPPGSYRRYEFAGYIIYQPVA